jgi:hypothetical protein
MQELYINLTVYNYAYTIGPINNQYDLYYVVISVHYLYTIYMLIYMQASIHI